MTSSAPISILIQGELGSFSHEAALAMLPGAEIIPCTTAAHLFGAMYNHVNTLAVIPIENSLAGSVLDFYDLLHRRAEQCKIKILREHQQRIRHNLIARPGTNSLDIQQVLSHPIALAQCRNFFNSNPHLQPVESYDTAGSVKMILEADNPRWAAIASKQAAEIYGGQILREGIEDNPENYTRFLLLEFENEVQTDSRPSERIPSVGAPDKMSLIITLKNQPGALVKALGIFSNLEMNLTKIESRPIQGRPWEYLFYVDVLFSKSQAADAAMAQLLPLCETIIDLGRYKAAVLS